MKLHIDDTFFLEPLKDSHAESMFELVNANRQHLSEWLPWVNQLQTVEHFRQFIFNSGLSWEKGVDFGFVILQNESVIGRIGIYRVDHPNKTGSIGYWLGADFTGKGIISRACEAITDYGFHTLGLNRIEIKCGTENTKSRAVAERLGFRLEGIMRQAEWLEDKCLDHQLFAMLKEDWESQEL